uniref:Uncharacterized protein n=1 Tax=Arundo donax TaxID=35708 RepID=A0A0A9HCF3_ARUDO
MHNSSSHYFLSHPRVNHTISCPFLS